MHAVQAVQAIHADKGIRDPLVSCDECHAVWHSVECERCPLCAQNVGVPYILNQEKIYELLYAVYQLDEERIERASEYEMWSFGNILREDVPWYKENCRRIIQACYDVLCEQEPSPKIVFAIECFEQAYLQVPEDPMMYHFDDDEEYKSWSDEDEW
jgi:hypothetical protein